jgi:hypothetical protein
MSINLLETVQQNLGYPPLQKIDPNTQTIFEDDKTPNEDRFSQAAIPAVIVGTYRLAQSDEGAQFLLNTTSGANLVNKAFEHNLNEMVQSIAAYAKQSAEDPITKINVIADEVLRVIKENLPDGAGPAEVKTLLSSQLNHVLLYLPPALNMGVIVDDTTLDDNTHKMEGPLSSMIQNLGNLFTTPADKDELEKPV